MNPEICRFLLATVCLIITFSSVGCKTVYRDPLLISESPSAVLIHKSPMMSGYLIDSIDGEPRPSGRIYRYELSEGKHDVIVGLNEGLYRADKIRIDFETKNGETYFLNADHNGILAGKWWAWITEESTGKRFNGEPAKKGDTLR